jgi:hypothetical protein
MSNQLDLFHGVVLTTEQQEQIDSFIKSQANRAVKCQEDINRTMLLLDEAGFVMGVDYSCNFEVEEVTSKREFGYSYNNTNFEYEVTYINSYGCVYLITDSIKDGKIKKHNATVDREGSKLMCTYITEQYRYYKPSTLLTKLKENRKSKIAELNRQNKEQVCLDYTVAKYQKLYPEATVKIGSDYYRGYRGRSYDQFKIVVIEFKSGSSVTFQLGYGYELDQERLHKRYDAQKETVEQSLERFNNQKAK